jgi:hypothetical protein
VNPSTTAQKPSNPISALDTLAPFLTAAGLAKVTGTGTDVFFSDSTGQLSPVEAHNHLKRYLYDDFRFKSTLDVYGFLTLIGSANTMNPSWVSFAIKL